MSIKYKILWIEDDVDYIESLTRSIIEDHIKSHGLILEIIFRSTEEEIEMAVDGMQYDLIVMDYNITNNDTTGATVIRSIRDKQCLTEVIFYSGNDTKTLRNIAAENELEGIFFSSRNIESLLYKICDVFDLNVRKIIDINNMRGLVMSGVSDLDYKLTSLISKCYIDFNVDENLNQRKKLVKKMMPNYQSIQNIFGEENPEFIEKFNIAIKDFCTLHPKEINELLENRLFDSYKRVTVAASLCKINDKIKSQHTQVLKILEILKWRNALAHQQPEIDNNTNFFLIDNNKIPFDKETSMKILTDIHSYESKLDEMLTLLES